MTFLQGKKLVACKASRLNDSGLTNHVDNQEQYLMTFKEFSSKTTKNKVSHIIKGHNSFSKN